MRIKTLAVASAAGGCHHGSREAAASYYHGLVRQKPNVSCGIDAFYSRKHYKLSLLYKKLYRATQQCTKSKQPFLVVEGDHSSAIGTWSGVLDGLTKDESLGLIWLDAHMDAHTFRTSPSGNLHGMPVAALLGSQDKRLQKLYPGKRHLDPENLVIIGLRSYEEGEKTFLDSLGVEYHTLDSIRKPTSLEKAMSTIVEKLKKRCNRIGLSIDMDVIDPRDVPAVATPVANGIRGKQLVQALASSFKNKPLCGVEISEYVPAKDPDRRSLKLMSQLINSVYPSSENKFLGSSNSGIKSRSLPS